MAGPRRAGRCSGTGPLREERSFPAGVALQEAQSSSKRAWLAQRKVLRGRGWSEGAGLKPRRL